MKGAAFVTGLKLEARIVRNAARRAGTSAPLVVVAGPAAPEAQRVVADLSGKGARAIVSFGLAGGLAASLPPGTLLLPRRVIAPERGGPQAVDEDWRQRFLSALAGIAPFSEDDVASSSSAVLTPQGKAAMHRSTGAVAVDMESHALAAAAERSGVPFLIMRAVADPATAAIPAAAAAAMRTDGGVSVAPLLRGLTSGAMTPRDLMRLQRHSAAAQRTLCEALRRLLAGGIP